LSNDVGLAGLFDGHVGKETERDRLRSSDRIGQLIGLICGIFFAVYFAALYNSGSEFFDRSFSTVDAFLFFGIAFLGMIPGLAKLIIGRKNVTRPLEVVLAIFTLLALAWFLYSFPFDLSHLADPLPQSLHFAVSWIDDGVAKTLMMFALVVNIVIIPYTALLYLAVRRRLYQKMR
jgi:cytochrome bd-type quinol oxidase subunit 2